MIDMDSIHMFAQAAEEKSHATGELKESLLVDNAAGNIIITNSAINTY
jgi:hypothetical protein